MIRYTTSMRVFFSTILLFVFFVLNQAIAQRQKLLNLPSYDNKPYHFGFLLGANSSSFDVKFNPNIKDFDSVMAVVPRSSAGFNLGIVTDARLNEYFNLRFIPQLSFVERYMIYVVRSGSSGEYYEIKKPVESTFIDFPFDIKYKSARLNNGRAYLVGGVKYSLDMATNKRAKDSGDEEIVKMKRHGLSYQLGFGLDIYTTYFKFSPEIRYGVGINNVLIKDAGIYSSSISKLYNRTLLICFTFE